MTSTLHRIKRLLPLAIVSALEIASSTRADDEFALGVRTTPPLGTAEELAKLHLPPGFEMQLVASEPDINKPMNLAFDALGRLWVTTSVEYPFPARERPGRDRLMIFEDFGPDGRARKVTQFADGLNIPIGVYPFRSPGAEGKETWKAIVWSIPNVWLMEDTDGDGRADRRELLYGPYDVSRDTHGNQASFRRGFDGWLYATHGFNNDSHVQGRDGNRVDLNSGNTYRMRLNGERLEHHTWGQVNPFGLAWDERGNLYSSDCHSAPVYQLQAGAFYPSFGKPHDGLGFAPVIMEHAHGSTAIDGMIYYTDDLWPTEYRDHVFIGNVMTSRLNQDRLEFHGSSPRAIEQPDFVVADDPWFRPVDNLLGPDGALYIADFYNRIIGHYEVPLSHPGRDHDHGRIWRVVYRGDASQPRLRPVALASSPEGLLEELKSPNLNRRLLAMNDLADRFGKQALPSIEQTTVHSSDIAQRVCLLWLLQRLNSPILDQQLMRALDSHDDLVRVHALRIVGGELAGEGRSATAGSVGTNVHAAALRQAALTHLQDPDALARRCAARALSAAPSFESVQPLLTALANADRVDTHLVYVLRQALRDQLMEPSVLKEVLARTWDRGEALAFADVAIAVPSEGAAAFLVRQLPQISRETNPQPGIAEILKHAARYAPAAELASLADFGRNLFGNAPELQLDLFKSIQKGLEQRGTELPTGIRNWGIELVGTLLDRPDPAAGWVNRTLENAPTSNPWDFEKRSFADGTRGVVLSSFPHGEALTGVLRSPVFQAPKELSFWVGGHDGPPDHAPAHKNRLCLRDARDHGVLQETPPPRNDVSQKIVWNLSSMKGREVYLEITDADTGPAYAWLDVARISPAVVPWPAIGPRTSVDQQTDAIRLASQLRLTERAPSLTALALAPDRDGDVRLAAAEATLILDPANAVTQFALRLTAGEETPVFRERLGCLLAEQHSTDARDAVLAALPTAPLRLQSIWASGLISTREGADALLTAVQQGRAAPRLLQNVATRNRIQAANPPDWEARITRLTRNLPPNDEARDQLIAQRRGAYDSNHVDPIEGQRLFRLNCAPCHQIAGEGGLVGPQLTGVGNRGLDRLCEDILDPNRNVDKAFRQTLLTLNGGDVVAGLLRREEGNLLVLADGTGKEFSVRKADVAQRSESDVSLMPDNFGEAISPTDFNDLMAYLLTQRPPR